MITNGCCTLDPVAEWRWTKITLFREIGKQTVKRTEQFVRRPAILVDHRLQDRHLRPQECYFPTLSLHQMAILAEDSTASLKALEFRDHARRRHLIYAIDPRQRNDDD